MTSSNTPDDLDGASPSTSAVTLAQSGAECLVAADMLARQFAARASTRDLERQLPFEEFDLIRAHGLQAIRVPKKFGGPGGSVRDLAEMTRIISKGDPNIAQALSPHLLAADAVMLWGTPAQQKKFCADIISGHIINNAFAERGGKFVGEIATRLTADGDGYRLQGQKFYSTGALMADQIYATAIMDDGVIALVFVPCQREGLDLIDDWDGMGQRATASGTTVFNNIRMERSEVMPLPMFATQRTFFGGLAQSVHAAIDTGIAEAALDDAVEFAGTKARPMPESGVDRQVDDPYVISTIGHMTVYTHQAEAMLSRAVDFLGPAVAAQLNGTVAGKELEQLLVKSSIAVAEAKITATDASLRVSEMLYNVAGASATLRKYNFDRHWRNARTHTTHDPVSYKYKHVGNYSLSGTLPPISTKF
ncbi:MAG: dehydrogenase [Rhodospirillaceae bacterium]|jgi:SfnB family sulfur acquisition oxidoreductase|nr:dehydrogenase [Rhodospirillaceae bacterium]MBT4486743.1 dehydrogenase [Rhodospirillaceae bacterium]MBT5881471.1 dehydrogenase [Rhodospirillaceae bacterium]MBT7287996.1 dehydrogenase [Rhodospirillaceae bacterium]